MREIAAANFGNGLGVCSLLPGLVGELRGRGINDEGGWDCSITEDIPVSDRAPDDADEDLGRLATVTTALRDLYMGYDPASIVPLSGGAGGLDKLLQELVAELRGRGIDDEGGWDCSATSDIPVAARPSY